MFKKNILNKKTHVRTDNYNIIKFFQKKKKQLHPNSSYLIVVANN